jgi:hypothetical protein
VTVPFDAGRRRLLIAAAGIGVSAAVGPRVLGLMLEQLVAADVAQVLRGLVIHRESAIQLGLAYLRAHPDEYGATELTALILGGRGVPRGGEAASVSARMRADFEARRVVTVDGWILSRTEARLYALCAVP